MTAAHTPGTLKVTKSAYCQHACTIMQDKDRGWHVASTFSHNPMSSVSRTHPQADEAAANARRLVACWNACEGVDTELLEQYPAPFSQLRTERDDLLTQLEVAQHYLRFAYDDESQLMVGIAAAIAKATGSAA